MSTDTENTTDLAVPSSLPAHLQNAISHKESTGLEEMGNYIVPPRLKIIQDKKDDKYESFASGDVIVVPQLEKLCSKGEPFQFTVLYTFDEFCVHNPYQLRASLPMIRERTIDPKSDLAEKARNMITEPCPENLEHEIKYVTHLNFLIAVHGIESLKGIELLVSFHLGEFKTGQGLLNLLRMRSNGGIPIYGHVLSAHSAKHSGGGFNWMGLDISNPSAEYIDAGGSQYVTDEDLYNSFEAAHNEAKANKSRIQADYGDADAVADAANVDAPESDTL
jgi:hypothetical protein